MIGFSKRIKPLQNQPHNPLRKTLAQLTSSHLRLYQNRLLLPLYLRPQILAPPLPKRPGVQACLKAQSAVTVLPLRQPMTEFSERKARILDILSIKKNFATKRHIVEHKTHKYRKARTPSPHVGRKTSIDGLHRALVPPPRKKFSPGVGCWPCNCVPFFSSTQTR